MRRDVNPGPHTIIAAGQTWAPGGGRISMTGIVPRAPSAVGACAAESPLCNMED